MAKPGSAGVCVDDLTGMHTHQMTLVDVLSHTEQTVNALKSSLIVLDSSIYKEFREIALYLAKTKKEVCQIQADDLRCGRIPEAGRELQTIVEATESATNRIMECAETIMTADPSNPATYHAIINDSIMSIFEACSFQDSTSQKISKIVETLTCIDERVSKYAKTMNNIDSQFSHTSIDQEESRRPERNGRLVLDDRKVDNGSVNPDGIDNLYT